MPSPSPEMRAEENRQSTAFVLLRGHLPKGGVPALEAISGPSLGSFPLCSFLPSLPPFFPSFLSLPFYSLSLLSLLPSLTFPFSFFLFLSPAPLSWLSLKQNNSSQNQPTAAQVQCYKLTQEEHWTLTLISSFGQTEDAIFHPLESSGMRGKKRKATATVGHGRGSGPSQPGTQSNSS